MDECKPLPNGCDPQVADVVAAVLAAGSVVQRPDAHRLRVPVQVDGMLAVLKTFAVVTYNQGGLYLLWVRPCIPRAVHPICPYPHSASRAMSWGLY